MKLFYKKYFWIPVIIFLGFISLYLYKQNLNTNGKGNNSDINNIQNLTRNKWIKVSSLDKLIGEWYDGEYFKVIVSRESNRFYWTRILKHYNSEVKCEIRLTGRNNNIIIDGELYFEGVIDVKSDGSEMRRKKGNQAYYQTFSRKK